MKEQFTVIDLFAGPGGLGEGFSAFRDEQGSEKFKIRLSIEKESSAHRTLQLRSFYRQFPTGKAPAAYYDFLSGKLGQDPEDELYKTTLFRKQTEAAKEESRNLTLGEDDSEIYKCVRKALNKSKGPWILVGGPPCQAYSVAGRVRNRGIYNYVAEKDHRNFLYREYLEIIAQFRPSVFIMENVKGLLSASIKGKPIFNQILNDLRCPQSVIKKGTQKTKYEIFSLTSSVSETGELFDVKLDPASLIIQSENYGIPQSRHRVILLGIRSDLARRITPAILQPCKSGPTVEDVIRDLPRLRSGLSKEPDSIENWIIQINSGIENVIRQVRNEGLSEVAKVMESSVHKISRTLLHRGSNWSVKPVLARRKKQKPALEINSWFNDPQGIPLVCNHETRGHIAADLHRYLFCAAYSKIAGSATQRTPMAHEFPKSLAPKHKNWNSGHFSDRFRVQSAKHPGTTITSHISKDGHYYIHYDPVQCRSLTVREAARIQTFPDNYFFVGNRTQQYVQVGNAVPPLLANQIAEIVNNIFEQ